MVAIEESKKVEEMKVEELKGTPEAHEQRITEKGWIQGKEKASEYQALQTYKLKRGGFKVKKKINSKRLKCFNCNRIGHFST